MNNKIREIRKELMPKFSRGQDRLRWIVSYGELLKAVIEEIEKLQEENYATPPADEEERIDESGYNAGLQKIKQLLEDSIKG